MFKISFDSTHDGLVQRFKWTFQLSEFNQNPNPLLPSRHLPVQNQQWKTRTMCQIRSKLTTKTKNKIIGVILVSLLFNWCCVFSSLHINHLIPWKKGYLTWTHLSKNGELNASSTEILCFGSRTSSFVIRSIVSTDALGYSLENGVGSLCGRRLM